MSYSRPVAALAVGACLICGSTARSDGGVFDGWSLQNERQPVYAPAGAEVAYGVVQTSHECVGGWSVPSNCHQCSPGGECDGCSACRSHWSLWWDHVKCRFKRCRWEEGLETCYPVCPPYAQPHHGYHETCWRRLPPLNPCPPTLPNTFAAPDPFPTGTHQLPPAIPPAPADLVAPPAPSDLIAPPAPSDLVAPPAPGGDLPQP
jgi:hypothetical protein